MNTAKIVPATIKSLIKIMELSEESEQLVNTSYHTIISECEARGEYHFGYDVEIALKSSMQHQKTIRKLLRDIITDDSSIKKENQNV
jgi:hypothetical protein